MSECNINITDVIVELSLIAYIAQGKLNTRTSCLNALLHSTKKVKQHLPCPLSGDKVSKVALNLILTLKTFINLFILND